MLDVTCNGKCDGLDSIRSLYRDARNLDLGDLLSYGAGIATDELNDALSFSDYGSIGIGEPVLYALPERARNDLTLHDIDELVSGLAARYGERELTTEVNRARRDYLASSGDEVFAESAFSISAALGHNWNIDVGGFENSWVNVGFRAGTTLEARVIGAYRSELGATGGAPLRALRESRGFVLPRTVADIRAMKPGESFALRGEGVLGVNFGAGVPIVLADPASLTYNLVISAALRARLSGTVDAQLVRLPGNEVVVDVGVEKARLINPAIALTPGWGVDGLPALNVNIAGIEVDLKRLAERALEKQLNKHLSFIEASAAYSNVRSRVSVARFRISLDQGDEDTLDKALGQALRGDVRLAQALSNRGEPGVVAEFDLLRSGASSAFHAGIDIFGMSFFTTSQGSQGTAIVQTPGGVRTLLFESLHKASGWFLSSFGMTRVGLAGLVFGPDSPRDPNGEANLFVQIMEGDSRMRRDELLDHLDAVIAGVGGADALAAIEVPGNELQRYVHTHCVPSGAWDPCQTDILSDPLVVQLRADGLAALDARLGNLEPAQRDLVLAAGKLRLTAQATREYPAAIVGPPTSIVLDYRLDDRALEELLEDHNGDELRNAVVAYLTAVDIDRGDSASDIAADRASILATAPAKAQAMAATFDAAAYRYQRLLASEDAVIATLGPVGARALEVRFPVDAANRPLYEEATANSLAQARSRVVTEMFDELMERAQATGRRPEQVVAYALLSLTPSRLLDLRVDVDFDVDETWDQVYEHYRAAGYTGIDRYGKGRDVARIDGGMFSVDALINVN